MPKSMTNNVTFHKSCKSYKTINKNIINSNMFNSNMFDVLNTHDYHGNNYTNHDYHDDKHKNKDFIPGLNEIIWGVGFKSMIGSKWSDIC